MLERIIRFVKDAGAPTEKASSRGGFLSYHAESHAAGMGIAAGWWYGAEGNAEFLSLVYAAAVHGSAKARNDSRRRILKDIADEPHYAVGGAVVGVLLGLATQWAVSTTGVDPFEVIQAVPLLAGVVA